MATDYLEDIPGSDHLRLTWGDRFRGWYQTVVFNRTELVDIEVKDLTYQFKVCTYEFRFIIPPRIEFFKGIGSDGAIQYGYRYLMDFIVPIMMVIAFNAGKRISIPLRILILASILINYYGIISWQRSPC